jgi:outer membrane protein
VDFGLRNEVFSQATFRNPQSTIRNPKSYLNLRSYKMKIVQLFLVSTLFFATTNSVQAQKIGHLNSGNMLEKMPDVLKADSVLVLYRKSLSDQIELLQKMFEPRAKQFIQDRKAGTLAPAEEKRQGEQLAKEEEQIRREAQEAEQKINAKRQALLQPIIDKINKAIQLVGKENKYDYIMDTASGSMLFVTESEDVAPLVKKKLGLN